MFGETRPLTPEQEYLVLRVRLAELFGWTFDTIDAMTVADLNTILAVKGAEAKRAAEVGR